MDAELTLDHESPTTATFDAHSGLALALSAQAMQCAIDKARDVEQIIAISKLLDEKGIAIDLQKQLGFINGWRLVGKFDNKDESGFDVVYGPEKSLEDIDTSATYEDELLL